MRIACAGGGMLLDEWSGMAGECCTRRHAVLAHGHVMYSLA